MTKRQELAKARAYDNYNRGSRVRAKFYAVAYLVGAGFDKDAMKMLGADELIKLLRKA